jgi:hypothetical protein
MLLNQTVFLGKVLGVSLLMSLAVKYVGPLLAIPPTTLAALVPVVGVPLVMALILKFQR